MHTAAVVSAGDIHMKHHSADFDIVQEQGYSVEASRKYIVSLMTNSKQEECATFELAVNMSMSQLGVA